MGKGGLVKQLTHGSLFAGIGGFDLGFERAGMKTVWEVEIDPYCRKVLERHFPHAERFADIRECGKHNLKPVDVISGGFPCQDVSKAGRRAGIKEGTRSGLWFEMLRVVCELRPRFAVVENVSGLLERELGRVLGDLAEVGYDGEWDCLPAAAVGAHHLRDRVFIVAYPNSERHLYGESQGLTAEAGMQAQRNFGPGCLNRELRGQTEGALRDSAKRFPNWAGGTVGRPRPITEFERPDGREIERDFCGMAHGVSRRVDRLKSLGNAIVPQIAEWIGSRIVEATREG